MYRTRPYRPKTGDIVESDSGYRGRVMGPVANNWDHVWVGNRLTAMGFYANELHPVSRRRMSDTTIVLLIGAGFFLAVLFFVLWLQRSDRQGQRYSSSSDGLDVLETIIVADAIGDIGSAIVDALDD